MSDKKQTVVVPIDTDANVANQKYGEAYGDDWRYESPDERASREKRESFEDVTRPVMKWLCENVHPHHTIIVTGTDAMLLEGQLATGEILDYVKG